MFGSPCITEKIVNDTLLFITEIYAIFLGNYIHHQKVILITEGTRLFSSLMLAEFVHLALNGGEPSHDKGLSAGVLS